MARKNEQLLPPIISPQAKEDLQTILHYLKEKWPQKTVDNFLQKLEVFYRIISINPHFFSYYNKAKGIRKYVLTKHNTIYYRIKKNQVEIITVFDGRQDPQKMKKTIKNHLKDK